MIAAGETLEVIRMGKRAVAQRPAGRVARRRRRAWTPIAFVAPAALVLLAITIFPLLYTLRLTLYSWELTGGGVPQFVGLQNFATILFQDGRFWNAGRNTALLVVFGVGSQLVLGLVLALLMNRLGRWRSLLVSLLLIPVMIAPVVSGFQFRMIYNDQLGPLNYLLALVGIRGPAWLADPRAALIAIMIADIWQWTPFLIMIILAGLQSVSHEMLEAAGIDGANRWQSFWRITLPMLTPVIVIGVLVRVMDSFKLFDLVYQLTGGGPGNTTETLAFYTYLQGFKFFSLGYTAALAFIQLVVITMIAQLFLAFQKRQRQEV